MEAGRVYPVRVVFRPESSNLSESALQLYMLSVNAQLSAATFDVLPESPPEQVLTEPEASLSWSWSLQPRMVGEQSLSLDLLFDWTPVSVGLPNVRAEPGAWYQTRTTRVNKPFPYWSLLQLGRNALVAMGLLCWAGWFALRGRRSQY
jgi:hypothetical protein